MIKIKHLSNGTKSKRGALKNISTKKIKEIKMHIYKLFDTINNPKIMMATLLALFCGLRIGELTKLRYEDIDLVKKQLKVQKSQMLADTTGPRPDGLLAHGARSARVVN